MKRVKAHFVASWLSSCNKRRDAKTKKKIRFNVWNKHKKK